MKKYKKYEISLDGFSDSDCSSVVRFLTKRQHMFLDELFDELMRRQGSSDYSPSIGVSEIKVRLSYTRIIDGRVVAYLENAEDLKVGQKLSYTWNKKNAKFEVVEVGQKVNSWDSVPVVLSPNDKVALLPKNATLETEYML